MFIVRCHWEGERMSKHVLRACFWRGMVSVSECDTLFMRTEHCYDSLGKDVYCASSSSRDKLFPFPMKNMKVVSHTLGNKRMAFYPYLPLVCRQFLGSQHTARLKYCMCIADLQGQWSSWWYNFQFTLFCQHVSRQTCIISRWGYYLEYFSPLIFHLILCSWKSLAFAFQRKIIQVFYLYKSCSSIFHKSFLDPNIGFFKHGTAPPIPQAP